MRKAVMTAFLVLMTTGFVSAGMVVDYFDYGPANGELGGQGAAASGWAGSWIAPLSLASFGPDYRADVNLSYVADGYDGTANSAGTGMAGYVKSTSPGYMTKRYFSTPATGTVWLSAILNYSASDADLLIWIDPPESGTGNPPVFIGVRSGAAKMRYGSDLTGPAVSVGTHLLLAKMEVDPAGIDTVSLWIDPDLSAGEAGLGAPAIVGNTLNKFGDSISGVAFSCSEHRNLGIDALRISADVDGFAMVTGQLLPDPEPVLLPQPAELGFTGVAADPVPAPQSVTVQNVGGGTLQWAAAVREPVPGWISLSNAVGSDGDAFAVSVDWQGMPPGTYVAHIDVTDSDAENSPQTVTVTMEVQPEPKPYIDLECTSLVLTGKISEPAPAPQAVVVQNTGVDVLQWTASVRSPAPEWLVLSNAAGGDGDAFVVSVDWQGVSPGTYTAYVDVTDPAAANSPQTVTVILQARPEAEASTQSFTNSGRGTHPGALTVSGGTITVDLSSLPAGTQVFRAVLVPHASGSKTTPLKIQAADQPGVWLDTLAPRYRNIDCTAATQRAMAGSGTLELNVVSLGGGLGSEVRLDVWCDAPPARSIQQVSGITAMHRDGDTMLTFAEVNPPVTHTDPTLTELKNAKAAMDNPNEIRYRIYRSAQPIDALTIRTAELVDEIGPMSGWNWNITTTSIIPTLPIDDMTPSAPGTGIYVRRAQEAGSAYYAISRAVDGEEDLSLWVPTQNSLAAAVAEDTGSGMVLQYREIGPASFQYVNDAIRQYFIRWECPPTWNVPSTPHNYLVGIPPVQVEPRPINVALHCWGGSMDSCYGWWYEAEHGALLVATNQIPYDWWTAFHENNGTIKPWLDVEGNDGGVIRNYNQKRVWSFVEDFVMNRWVVDFNHIMVAGNSMGGSGASMWGMRAGEKFAYINSWVGVHIPALTPVFLNSFEDVYGTLSWDCLYEDTGMSVWDYWDNDRWLRENVAVDTPFITFANGKNDSAIGWQQAWMMAKALQETRRPHLFRWGQNGHQERAEMPGTLSNRYINIDIDLDDTLPAFTYCSLDDDPGDGDPGVGDASGYLNRYLLWQPDDSVDTAARWEMTCLLIGAAPQASCTVDITPRRCQAFRPAAGTVCTWTNTDLATGEVIESGSVTVDEYGLVTIPQTTVRKTRNRIAIRVAGLEGDVDGDGEVSVLDIVAVVTRFGATPADANWDAACDFDADGEITVLDIVFVVTRFGNTL